MHVARCLLSLRTQLVVTFVVSMLHLLFDVLSFQASRPAVIDASPLHQQSEINFWRNRKDYGGLSGRTILLVRPAVGVVSLILPRQNTVCQVVVTMYLLDQETSYLVLVSAVVGTSIAVWKLKKVFRARLAFQRCMPRLQYDPPSANETRTMEVGTVFKE